MAHHAIVGQRIKALEQRLGQMLVVRGKPARQRLREFRF
jgi:DNA-binding transcriptional LysR family regulator